MTSTINTPISAQPATLTPSVVHGNWAGASCQAWPAPYRAREPSTPPIATTTTTGPWPAEGRGSGPVSGSTGCCSSIGCRGWSATAPPGSAADGGDVELQADLLRDQHATGLQGGVEVHAPVLAVDGGLALEACPLVAVGVGGHAGVLEVHGHRVGDALDGEVAGEPVVLRVHALNVRRDEADLRVSGGVEEVVGAQVPVALLVAGVDAAHLGGQVDVRVGRVVQVQMSDTREVVERAADLGHHRVPRSEADAAVRGVDGPGAGQGVGGGGSHLDSLVAVDVSTILGRSVTCQLRSWHTCSHDRAPLVGRARAARLAWADHHVDPAVRGAGPADGRGVRAVHVRLRSPGGPHRRVRGPGAGL